MDKKDAGNRLNIMEFRTPGRTHRTLSVIQYQSLNLLQLPNTYAPLNQHLIRPAKKQQAHLFEWRGMTV